MPFFGIYRPRTNRITTPFSGIWHSSEKQVFLIYSWEIRGEDRAAESPGEGAAGGSGEGGDDDGGGDGSGADDGEGESDDKGLPKSSKAETALSS